jgi:hypothetical protein
MSEINAIATNNYLLATQQEVSHDNTLSGNGTVESPLGVSETVLWESTTGTADTGVFSENITNFEYFDVVFKTNDNIIEVQRFRTDMSSSTFNLYSNLFSTSNGLYIKITRMNYSATQFTVNNYAEINIKNAANPTISQNNKIVLLKVIGINRKA